MIKGMVNKLDTSGCAIFFRFCGSLCRLSIGSANTRCTKSISHPVMFYRHAVDWLYLFPSLAGGFDSEFYDFPAAFQIHGLVMVSRVVTKCCAGDSSFELIFLRLLRFRLGWKIWSECGNFLVCDFMAFQCHDWSSIHNPPRSINVFEALHAHCECWT